MKTLDLDLGARSYPIHVGRSLLGRSAELLDSVLPERQLLVVSDSNVAPHYLDSLLAQFSGQPAHSLVLPPGEAHKTLETTGRIIDVLVANGFHRDCCLIALGGGVIGDMTGFAAACYQRGVQFVQIPTTLLAQVDASVGGKTGVNHPRGKNMIGAFHQPAAVLIDTQTLDTLPDRELRAGLAEVIKHAVIADAGFFAWLEEHMPALLARDAAALEHAIETCCRIKAVFVAADEREAGQRALLNLGHTFGHAIETGMGHGTWLHGEAVAAGMVLAARTAERLDMIDAAGCARIEALCHQAGLPVQPPPALGPAEILRLMGSDKKVQKGRLRLILPTAIGQAVIHTLPDTTLLEELIAGS